MTALTEAQLTRQVADLLDWALPDAARFTHIASGGHRLPAVAAQLHGQGVRRGAPDFIIVVPGVGIIFIELKSAAGQLSDEQHQWGQAIEATPGARWFVCRSIDGVIEALTCAGVGVPLKISQPKEKARSAETLSGRGA